MFIECKVCFNIIYYQFSTINIFCNRAFCFGKSYVFKLWSLCIYSNCTNTYLFWVTFTGIICCGCVNCIGSWCCACCKVWNSRRVNFGVSCLFCICKWYDHLFAGPPVKRHRLSIFHSFILNLIRFDNPFMSNTSNVHLHSISDTFPKI